MTRSVVWMSGSSGESTVIPYVTSMINWPDRLHHAGVSDWCHSHATHDTYSLRWSENASGSLSTFFKKLLTDARCDV